MGKRHAVFWLALLALAGTAAADDQTQAAIGDHRFTAGDDVQIEEPVEGNAFAAGARVGVTARVGRSAFLSGGEVTVSAPVGRNLYMAGGNVRLDSAVYGKLRAAGGHVRVASEALVDGDASLSGGSVEVDGGVNGDLRAHGESIVINGTIGGDAELTGERIRIGPDARILGSLFYRSGGPIVIDSHADVSGEVVERQKDRRWLRRMGRGETFVGGSFSLGIVLIGALLILALPRFTREAGAVLRDRPVAAGGVGFAMVVCVPLMLLLLVITVIGIPLAILFAFGYAAMLLLGYLVAAICIGDAVLWRVKAEKLQSAWWRILFMLLALLAFAAVKIVPILGSLVVTLVFLGGIGAFTMRAWKGFRRDADERPAPA